MEGGIPQNRFRPFRVRISIESANQIVFPAPPVYNTSVPSTKKRGGSVVEIERGVHCFSTGRPIYIQLSAFCFWLIIAPLAGRAPPKLLRERTHLRVCVSMRMRKTESSTKIKLLLLLLFFFPGSGYRVLAAASLGINYGKVANNLPAPAEVVRIIQSTSISKAKLYDTDPLVLKTFRNTDISFLVAVKNEDLGTLSDTAAAMTWVQQNILSYYPDTQIIGIVVGNEIFSNNVTSQWPQVLPGMINIYTALTSLGLQNKIMVSTTHSFSILSSSFPPSTGAFKEDIGNTYIKPILNFLSATGAPFMINAYPFFAYKDNPTSVSLGYVLFEQNDGVADERNGLRYYNMFDAQLDAVYWAIESLGFNNISILVSETGWPSAGDTNEAGATVENAQMYHANLFQHLLKSTGTPFKPNVSLDVYLFALFNEDEKTGPMSERHYGLFQPDGSKVYSFDFSQLSSGFSHRWHWASVATCMIGTWMALLNL